ncbi:uncharacterized protein LACBIDRAFT_335865 [Laccaria bicolor S238N-H82]|uniref:Predicted protein n=1 Tax=Laccaria bicolor (strain S238N-H82 / ATCC MYA-4686) TaxID=486041 RepID=B0E3N7_LACBS|nr:uncharacterized protein LACBIDRAFT_335865 [Laccaria bicolor S238N-H82]EDQ98537.1 predicted protein [Laccaria bicolor S238N-H82]|eukprot:XP_001890806.1 predicted protein [Laccaria bicolor S238N-H82]
MCCFSKYMHVGSTIIYLGHPTHMVQSSDLLNYFVSCHQWEQLPPGYTTEKPQALHDLAELEAWWEEAEIIAQGRADELDDESAGRKESAQEAVQVESGGEKGAKEEDHQAESRPQAGQNGEKGYRSSSCRSASDEAKVCQCEWAFKNRGQGHDKMDNTEEEEDDETFFVQGLIRTNTEN